MGDSIKMTSSPADPVPMPDDRGQGETSDPFGLDSETAEAPPPLWEPGEERRALIAELRALIERDDYDVPADRVAGAIIDATGKFPIIDWLD